MSCCITRINGMAPGGAGVTPGDIAAVWTERYLGDFRLAPEVDLTAGVNPTITLVNETTTADQVASALWTSNAGDALATVTQGNVTTFDTDNTAGLRMEGADASTNFTEVAQQAPHIWTFWDLLLGEDPRAGTDMCILVRVTNGTENLVSDAQAFGTGIYAPNDGAANPTLLGNPAIDDEKRLAGWLERISENAGITCREESTQFQQLRGVGLPAGFNVFGLMFSKTMAQAVVGIAVGDVFPEPDTMIAVPGPFFGGTNTFPGHPYLTPEERIVIVFQQQLGSTYNANISLVQVLTRHGRIDP